MDGIDVFCNIVNKVVVRFSDEELDDVFRKGIKEEGKGIKEEVKDNVDSVDVEGKFVEKFVDDVKDVGRDGSFIRIQWIFNLFNSK